jgi:hypothetical protein
VLEGSVRVPPGQPAVERDLRPRELEPPPSPFEEDDIEEVGRPEGPLEERHVDPFGMGPPEEPEAVREPQGEEASESGTQPPRATDRDPDEASGRREARILDDPGDDASGSVVAEEEAGPSEGASFGRRRGRRR